MSKKTLLPLIVVVLLGAGWLVWNNMYVMPRVLVFSKTEGYRHTSIEPAKQALMNHAASWDIVVDTTEDASSFTDENLRRYDVVMFLSTTQDVLDERAQTALQRFVEAGGGFAGVHSASDTEYDWPWYGRLVGAWFVSHPNIREAPLQVVDTTMATTSHLPQEWIRTDEWYDMRMVSPDVHVLINVDESRYKQPEEDPRTGPHPMSWVHEFDGGRAFYTALGHTVESWSEPAFLEHVRGGISWAADHDALDYSRPGVRPADSEFQMTVLTQNLYEPMELDVLPDGRILFTERHGDLHLVDPGTGAVTKAATLDVFDGLEDGLLGMELAPDFEQSGWVYLYYSPAGNESVQHVSRFRFTSDSLDLDSEQVLLEVHNQRIECCHSGGSVDFGPDGLLYISTGDDTNPFASDGFSPMDERAGRSQWDAQRSAANSMDLRGKILRIRPESDGSYSIPPGNLFPEDGGDGRPEIFIMGDRNPFRISIDSQTGWLYWGEIGPDASDPDPLRGPAGHDEVNQARTAGFYGWPYFVADNKPYRRYNFESVRSGDFQDPRVPVNDSPNNTGARILPAAQPAFLWYTYSRSEEFPLFGPGGGRSAMAGPVFRAADYSDASSGFPAYFEGRLFVHEWMRNKILVVKMNEQGRYDWMESFLPDESFSRPVDIKFGPEGSMYVLEYGDAWNAQNEDARLVKIDFKK